MKIALFGATGNIGSRILHEALARGHEVTSIVRDPKRLNVSNARMNIIRGNVLESGSVAATVAGMMLSSALSGLGTVNLRR